MFSEATALGHHGGGQNQHRTQIWGALCELGLCCRDRTGSGAGGRPVPKDPPHPLGVEESHVPDHGTAPVVADQHGLWDALRGRGTSARAPTAASQKQHPRGDLPSSEAAKRSEKRSISFFFSFYVSFPFFSPKEEALPDPPGAICSDLIKPFKYLGPPEERGLTLSTENTSQGCSSPGITRTGAIIA